MEFVKELFEKYEIRKNKKQKTQFIDWVKEMATDKGWEFSIQDGVIGTRNIIIGNPDKAKVIYTAHYDTCAKMIVPNFITPKNFLVYLLYQIIICFLLFVPIIAFDTLFVILFPDLVELSFLISYILLLVVLWLMMAGPANKHTANDNTSGVATILGLVSKFDPKDEVALILFDYEEIGLVGSSVFASKHKDIVKNTLLVNFDCVSDGDTMLFVLNKKTKNLMDTFKESYESNNEVTTDVVCKGVFYPSDQVQFKKGIGVCSMKKNKLFRSGYIDRIHTSKDTVFREENIKFLVDGSYKLYKNITK